VVVRYSHAARNRSDQRAGHLADPANFGDVLSAGDFNHDGTSTWRCPTRGEFVPPPGDVRAFGGAVWVFSGGPNGLDTGTVQHFNLNTPGIPYTCSHMACVR
jgi:hypothetical protein